MSEYISTKILTQTSENIQRLFDLTTRIDERVKTVQENQKVFENKLIKLAEDQNHITQNIAVLNSKNDNANISGLTNQVDEIKKTSNDFDKRLSSVEDNSGKQQDRWKNITSFIIQLIWIIIASWLLMRFGLSPPPLP